MAQDSVSRMTVSPGLVAAARRWIAAAPGRRNSDLAAAADVSVQSVQRVVVGARMETPIVYKIAAAVGYDADAYAYIEAGAVRDAMAAAAARMK